MFNRRRFGRTALLSVAASLALHGGAGAQPDPGPAAEGGDTILPGWWTYTATALLVASKTERRCIKPNEIDRVMSGAVNHHYRCTYPSRSQSFGRVAMKGVCTDKKGTRIPIAMTGAFTPTTLDMQVKIAGVIPISVHGRRLSATCPAPGETG